MLLYTFEYIKEGNSATIRVHDKTSQNPTLHIAKYVQPPENHTIITLYITNKVISLPQKQCIEIRLMQSKKGNPFRRKDCLFRF